MNDIERANSLTTSPYSTGLSSSSRRSQRGLTFSAETSGAVDAFAQVFAQMSVTVRDAGNSATATEETTLSVESSSAPETNEDDRELSDDVSSEDVKESSDSVREAFLQSLTNVNQPVQVDAEDTSVAEEDTLVSTEANVVDETVTQTTGKLDDAPATQPEPTITTAEEPSKTGDTKPQLTDFDLENTAESGVDLGENSQKPDLEPASTNATETVTVETPEVALGVQSAESPKLEGKLQEKSEATDSDDEPELLDREFASQVDSSEDRGSRRSARRNHQDRDHSRGVEQSQVEVVTEKTVDKPPPILSGGEAMAPSTASEPQSPEIASSADVALTPKTAAPASAVASIAAVANAAAPRTSVTPASASSRTSSSDATAPIQSLGPATNARSSGTEKTTAANGNSADDAVTRAKLVQRVSRAFQHFGAEGGSIRLRLAPAELGSVRVEMHIQSGKVNARVVAETEAASTILRDHLADLRSRLESQGMQVESFEIETDEQSFSSSKDPYGQEARDGYQERSHDDRPVSEPRVARIPVSRDVPYAVDVHDPVLLTTGVDAKF